MQKQTILFNLDDTLIYCNRYFNQVIKSFTEQMTKWFSNYSREEIKKKQLEIDLQAIRKYGLRSDRFPESFVKTYQYFCNQTGKEKKASDMDYLRELGNRVFKIPVEPIPFMNETLQRLKDEGHELYLHTGGDEANQRRKITQLELTTYFENRIFISEHKNSEALSKILKTIQADRKATWMVGNSLRTDIAPALQLKINAIYIPAEMEWKFNLVDINVKPQSLFIKLESLREVPDAIEEAIQMENQYVHDDDFLEDNQANNFYNQ